MTKPKVQKPTPIDPFLSEAQFKELSLEELGFDFVREQVREALRQRERVTLAARLLVEELDGVICTKKAAITIDALRHVLGQPTLGKVDE